MIRETSSPRNWTRRKSDAGLTLLELIFTIGILLILSTAAIPVFRMTVQHRKEAELRYELREMRNAIDRYKDDADKNLIRTEVGSENYPPDLQTLVDGVTISGGNGGIGVSAASVASASQLSPSQSLSAAGGAMSDMPSKVRYLRKVPVDPMTGKADWGMRSVQDDPDSTSWGGHNVFDVYTQSTGTATDGTKYSDW
ncbi:MAG TPA: type II secretion system protein [Verrucomicrobiae bacterium]|jgi:general secretion pathway protein G|nr:type II secretion system protein [Verrucomicrobiae bacterium]